MLEGRGAGSHISQPLHNEEDDYEDMVTPTDDEGITSLNHTQKIPISLIKAKDKASVSKNSFGVITDCLIAPTLFEFEFADSKWASIYLLLKRKPEYF